MRTKTAIICASVLALITTIALAKKPMSKEEVEKWFKSDAPAKPVREINEGKLTFLDPAKHRNVMHSDNGIEITRASLKTGWVRFKQCYRHLDPFPKVQVVYKYRKMRNLKLLSFTGIKKAWVEGQSVQLDQVKKGASLCVKAEVQSFYKNGTGWVLKNGPYRKRFLDGYFPMRVTITVKYPKGVVYVKQVKPVKALKAGQKAQGRIILDAVFEGILNTEIRFRRRTGKS